MDIGCDYMFLCEGELGFLMSSLRDMLTSKGISTDRCDINMKHLGNIKNIPYMFIVDAELLIENNESRVYLFDLCIEQSRKLVIIGDVDPLEKAMRITSPKIIATTFKRPINNQEVAEKLELIWENVQIEKMRKHILVVDDSPVFLRTISEWLEDSYIVNICPSATAAFHMIEVNKPDLILLDYEMPICSGAQFMEMLRSESASSGIPVIFLTSRSDEATVRKVLSLGPEGYLLKTLPKEDIIEAIGDFFVKLKAK